MSLSRVQARVIANSGLFDNQIREFIRQIETMAPLLRRLALRRSRHRSRVVTRRKQRGKW